MPSSTNRSRSLTPLRGVCVGWLAAMALSSCADGITPPTGEIVSICHGTGPTATPLDIHMSELAGYRQQGDYVAKLIVDKGVARGDSIHFTRIGDALAAARAGRIARNETTVAACRVTIDVGAGVFQGSSKESPDPTFERFPLVIDVPDVTVHGAFSMGIDPSGRATGDAQGTASTTLAASPGLLTTKTGGAQSFLSEPLIVVTDVPNGPVGTGAIVEGFLFQAGNGAADGTPGGNGVYAMRAKGLVVRRNRFEGGFSSPISFTASDAVADQNYLIGKGGNCALCLAGPGAYSATGNRLMGPGGIPGILILPVSLLPVPPVVVQQVLPASSLVVATIANNEVRNHLQAQAGAGLRIGALGVGGSDVVSSSRVIARNNTLVNNTFGVMLEAAFPALGTTRKGNIDLTLQDNVISGSCQNNLYVAFARNSTGLGLLTTAQFQSEAFLENSTYTLILNGDLKWQDAWVAHLPAMGNTLMVDGAVIDTGTRTAFDATKVCTPI